jgi:hypothetical protein
VTTVPCSLCATPRDPARRCPECGLAPGFGPDAANPFATGVLWVMMGVIAAVFVVTLLVVAVTS